MADPVARFCASCGTEVDERALFCPTCGQPVEEDLAREIPPAPAWPDDEPGAGEPGVAAAAAPAQSPAERASSLQEPPTMLQDRPRPEAGEREEPALPSRPGAASDDEEGLAERLQSIEVPVTWPVTLSGWLIGVGAFVGAISMFLPWRPRGVEGFGGFDSAVNVLLLVALLAIAASVFFSARVPSVPHQRLGVLVVVMIGLGVGLDRIGLGGAGVGAAFFLLAMLAAAIGAVLVETGTDRPIGGWRG